jgi:hypothetical protein
MTLGQQRTNKQFAVFFTYLATESLFENSESVANSAQAEAAHFCFTPRKTNDDLTKYSQNIS